MTHSLSAAELRTVNRIAESIGQVAFRLLVEEQEGTVIGTSSNGLYVSFSNDSILFVSFEIFHSPLTVILTDVPLRLGSIEIGAPVWIASRQMLYPSIGVAISLQEETVWRCPAASGIASSVSERLGRLEHMAKAMVLSKAGRGFAPLLFPLLGLSTTGDITLPDKSTLKELELLRRSLRMREIPPIVKILNGLMGRGRGLTPSGDDLIVGLLLVLNRWQSKLWTPADLAELGLLLIQAAHQKTTTLAASLIECAAHGESDERLVNAVDCIFTGEPQIYDCISRLESWGESSGADCLVGMTVALTGEPTTDHIS
jgi:hypothetical protein